MARLPVATTPWWQSALVILGGLAAAVLIGWLAARLSERAIQVVVTRFSINDAGQDELDLMCPDCPDGSVLAAGSSTATFDAGRAVLHPAHPLQLGKNELELRLVDAAGKGIKVEDLQVEVAYRLSTQWTGLHQSPPFGELIIEAPEGTTVRVDGTALSMSQGRAIHRVVVDEASRGEASKARDVERTLDVRFEDGQKTREEKARLQTRIIPLVLSSPGPAHQLGGQDVTVAGTTLPRARLTLGGHSTQADSTGQFRLLLPKPKAQKLEIVAELPELMVRRIPLWLADDVPVAPEALSDFDAIEGPGEVNLYGNVIEARIQAGVTQALVEVESGCESAPCLAQVVYAEPRKLVPNRSLRIAGWAEPGDPVTIRVRKFH